MDNHGISAGLGLRIDRCVNVVMGWVVTKEGRKGVGWRSTEVRGRGKVTGCNEVDCRHMHGEVVT